MLIRSGGITRHLSSSARPPCPFVQVSSLSWCPSKGSEAPPCSRGIRASPLYPLSSRASDPKAARARRASSSTLRLSAASAGLGGGGGAMEPQLEAVIQRLHGNNTKAVAYVTGGGVSALSWLLSVPGASNTVLEASVPYAREALVDALDGSEPEQYCSEDTAVQIARAAYRRAAALTGFGARFVGLGVTCALASVPPKRGEHRAFVACHSQSGTRTLCLTLAKGERTRSQEDALAGQAAVKLLAEASGVDCSDFQLPLVAQPSAPGGPVDVVRESRHAAPDAVDELLSGRARCAEFSPGGVVVLDAPRRDAVLLPGSFNPLHDGHVALLQAAQKAAGLPDGAAGDARAAFEMSVWNADKGWLPADEVRRRVAQFTERGLPVVVTKAPLFVDKAELMRRCRFVLGYDTAYRIVMPKYYNNSETDMLLEFARLEGSGSSFLVAGRKDDASGAFKGLQDIDVPERLKGLFRGIPEDAFRVDLSSSEIRARQAAGAPQR